jgi:hypothetical protein
MSEACCRIRQRPSLRCAGGSRPQHSLDLLRRLLESRNLRYRHIPSMLRVASSLGAPDLKVSGDVVSPFTPGFVFRAVFMWSKSPVAA